MIRYIALCGRDRQENLQMLQGLAPLKKHGGLEFVCFESGHTLLEEYGRGRRFDLILLNVGKDGSGLNEAIQLHRVHPAMSLILLADNEQWAIPGYRTRACGYVVRPFSDSLLREEVWLALTHCETPDFYYSFSSEEGTVQIKHSEIYYFESDVRRITLVGEGASYQFSGQISQIAQQLEPFRVCPHPQKLCGEPAACGEPVPGCADPGQRQPGPLQPDASPGSDPPHPGASALHRAVGPAPGMIRPDLPIFLYEGQRAFRTILPEGAFS